MVLTYRNKAEPKFDWSNVEVGQFCRQIELVKAFFESFKSKEGGFEKDYFPYTSPNKFSTQLEADLDSIVLDLITNKDMVLNRRRSELLGPSPISGKFLQCLKTHTGRIKLLGLDVNEIQASSLPQIYVPALVPARRIADESEHSLERPEREGYDLLLHRLGEDSLYLLGDPGTGKSVFCRWVIWAAANGAVPVSSILPPEGYTEVLPESLIGRLPILIPLRTFGGYMNCDRDRGSYWQYQLENDLGHWLDETRPCGLSREIFKRHLKAGNCLLIFDGVDEVPESSAKAQPRQSLVSGLIDAVGAWCENGTAL